MRRTLSVRLSVCPSVPLSLPSVTSFRQPLASRMYFSARTEGRISYGHLGRTDSCFYQKRFDKKAAFDHVIEAHIVA